MCMEVKKATFLMMLHQVSDGTNGTTAQLAKDLLKADPGKVKFV